MNKLRFAAALLPLMFAFASCEEPVVEPTPDDKADDAVPAILLRKTEIEIASDGAPVNVAYQIENPVEGETVSVANESEWLTVNAENARMLTLSASVNETGEVRKAAVVISYKGAEDVTLEVSKEFFVNPLKLEISDVTATGLTFSVTTSDESLTWIPMVTYKESFEYFETADELFQNDLEYFAYLADIQDVTRAEFIASMVAEGSLSDIPFDGLQPSTDYVLYAYGVTTDGRRTTDIVHEEFRTEEPYEGDITFSFDVVEEDYILNYTITPSHTGVPYVYGMVTALQFDEWKLAHGGDLRAAIQAEDIDATIEELTGLGMISGPEDYFSIFSESNVMDYGYSPLKASTKYVIYAAKWDEQCRLIGPVSIYEHTSQSIGMSDNQITIEVKNVTQSSADVEATVTTDDPYVVIPVRKSEIAGMADDELFAYLTEKYDYIVSEYTFTGNKTKTFGRMRPDTEYVIVAFGFKAGTLTTSEVDKVDFKTLQAGNPADCTFEFKVEPDVDCAFVEVTPSDKGQFYHWLVYPVYYTADDVKNYITQYIQSYYEGEYATFASWELSLGDDSTTAWDLYPETEYKVGAVVMDYDTGEFLSEVSFSEPFTTLAKTYADITFDWEYGPYYDLGELIRAGQTQFEALLADGNAIMPIKVSVNGKCSAFYYDIYPNDLSDTEEYPDEMFYAGLEYGCTYAKSNFVVKYDTPMTLVAMAYDYDNNVTQLYRDVLFFTQDGASPAKDFIASLKSASSSMKKTSTAAPRRIGVTADKRIDRKELQDMQARREEAHERAVTKVNELRADKMEKDIMEAKLRKSRMIAK